MGCLCRGRPSPLSQPDGPADQNEETDMHDLVIHGATVVDGLGASYSLNHSGWGGVPMPSTISELSEFDALVGAMGGPGRGVVEISSGATPVETMEQIAARHGRRIFMSTAT